MKIIQLLSALFSLFLLSPLSAFRLESKHTAINELNVDYEKGQTIIENNLTKPHKFVPSQADCSLIKFSALLYLQEERALSERLQKSYPETTPEERKIFIEKMKALNELLLKCSGPLKN